MEFNLQEIKAITNFHFTKATKHTHNFVMCQWIVHEIKFYTMNELRRVHFISRNMSKAKMLHFPIVYGRIIRLCFTLHLHRIQFINHKMLLFDILQYFYLIHIEISFESIGQMLEYYLPYFCYCFGWVS